jgi:hypothetical protein
LCSVSATPLDPTRFGGRMQKRNACKTFSTPPASPRIRSCNLQCKELQYQNKTSTVRLVIVQSICSRRLYGVSTRLRYCRQIPYTSTPLFLQFLTRSAGLFAEFTLRPRLCTDSVHPVVLPPRSAFRQHPLISAPLAESVHDCRPSNIF